DVQPVGGLHRLERSLPVLVDAAGDGQVGEAPGAGEDVAEALDRLVVALCEGERLLPLIAVLMKGDLVATGPALGLRIPLRGPDPHRPLEELVRLVELAAIALDRALRHHGPGDRAAEDESVTEAVVVAGELERLIQQSLDLIPVPRTEVGVGAGHPERDSK